VRDQEWLREAGYKGKGKDGKGKRKLPDANDIFKAVERERFLQALHWAEAELGKTEGPWFLGGPNMSIVDLGFSSVIERGCATAFYYRGECLFGDSSEEAESEFPNLRRLMFALAELATYRACANDTHTHAHIHTRLGRWGACVSTQRAASAQTHVDDFDLLADPPEKYAMPWIFSSLLSGNLDRPMTHDALEAAFAMCCHWRGVIGRACQQTGISGVRVEDADHVYRCVVDVLAKFGQSDFAATVADLQDRLAREVDTLVAVQVPGFSVGQRVAAYYSQEDQFFAATIETIEKDGWYKVSWPDFPDYTSWASEKNLLPSLVTVASPLWYTADRVSVPRDMGAGAARILRGSLHYCANRILSKYSCEEMREFLRIPVPVRDRMDQNPEGFFGL